MKPKHIVILTAILLVLIFFIQNTQIVTLRLFFWKFSMTQIILLPLTMIVGFALGYIVAKVRGTG